MIAAPGLTKVDPRLPSLRQDLRLYPTSSGLDGAPRWVIFDPIRHRYFQIGLEAFELLGRWSAETVGALIGRVNQDLGRTVSKTEVDALVKFLLANGLTRDGAGQGWRSFEEQARAGRRSPLKWLVHNYLFVRIPLVRPQRFLNATCDLVAPLWQTWFLALIALMGVTGLYLVSRQWDTFIGTLLGFATLEGLAFYGLVLIGVKACHELGHAYTATRFGCRVPTMGVALMVLYPVLYTDVTDAWRLTRRRERLLVDSAGVIVELMIASVATLLWVFLPGGIVRSVCFVLGTTGWILTLAVNLNPFLRFDGYYFLSDLLGVENLGPRSFAFGRWRLREWLFDLRDPPPEVLTPRLRTTLIVYAYLTWVYRLFLFLGIALLVYAFFFKALGIILFAVEILWFIVLPVARECTQWWGMRERIMARKRAWISATALFAIGAACLLPWHSTIIAPAVLRPVQNTAIYPPDSAQISEVLVGNGDSVEAGQPLVVMTSPELRNETRLVSRRIELHELRLNRRAADYRDLEQTLVLKQQLEADREALDGLREQIAELTVVAPHVGVIADLDPALGPGLWVSRDTRLADLVGDAGFEVEAMLSEDALSRVKRGAAARFVPDDPQLNTLDVRLLEIDETSQGALTNPYFSSQFGGRIATETDDDGRHIPVGSAFRSRLRPEGPIRPGPDQSGVVRIEAEPESFARAAWRRVAGVLVRETGF